jgi:Amt family ammonium transporter
MLAFSVPASAQGTSSAINAGDTAWVLASSALVMLMTPGLGLFYAGMVRKKNVLATMAQSFAATFLVSILWAIVGYSLAFTREGAFIGTLERIFLDGVMLDAVSPLAKTIPESLFMIYQMTFAIITVALSRARSPTACGSLRSCCSACSGCCWSMYRSRIGCGAADSSAPTA